MSWRHEEVLMSTIRRSRSSNIPCESKCHRYTNGRNICGSTKYTAQHNDSRVTDVNNSCLRKYEMKQKVQTPNEPTTKANGTESRKHISCDITKSSSVGDIRSQEQSKSRFFHNSRQSSNDLSTSFDISSIGRSWEATLRASSQLSCTNGTHGRGYLKSQDFTRKSYNEKKNNSLQNDTSSKKCNRKSHAENGFNSKPQTFWGV